MPSMMGATVNIMENPVARHTFTGEVPAPEGLSHPVVSPFSGYRTKDGLIFVAISNTNRYRVFVEALGPPCPRRRSTLRREQRPRGERCRPARDSRGYPHREDDRRVGGTPYSPRGYGERHQRRGASEGALPGGLRRGRPPRGGAWASARLTLDVRWRNA